MSCNYYLTNLANSVIVRDAEKESIKRSIGVLSQRLEGHFNGTTILNREIKSHFLFGSYARGTNLPQSIDSNSDVDYMVVFNDTSSRPQTYLDRLRRFVEKYYSRSEIRQSNPTIILNLNHIRFELVPAIDPWIDGLQIPAKPSSYVDWISTDPNDFDNSLTNKNQAYNSLIKPLIRLAKYWNATNQYPFDSFDLEKRVVNHGFWGFGMKQTLWGMVRSFMSDLDVSLIAPSWKHDRIRVLHLRIDQVTRAENSYDYNLAIKVLEKIFPPV